MRVRSFSRTSASVRPSARQQHKGLSADQVVTAPQHVVELAPQGHTIGRFNFEPGWRWSECVRPGSAPTHVRTLTSAMRSPGESPCASRTAQGG
jgi:hypothetical protein